MIVLLVLIVLALLVLYIRARSRTREPHTAREFYEAQDRLTKSGEFERKKYFKEHPRPEWKGEDGGETK